MHIFIHNWYLKEKSTLFLSWIEKSIIIFLSNTIEKPGRVPYMYFKKI